MVEVVHTSLQSEGKLHQLHQVLVFVAVLLPDDNDDSYGDGDDDNCGDGDDYDIDGDNVFLESELREFEGQIEAEEGLSLIHI